MFSKVGSFARLGGRVRGGMMTIGSGIGRNRGARGITGYAVAPRHMDAASVISEENIYEIICCSFSYSMLAYPCYRSGLR